MCGFISTEFLRLTVDSFEGSLASDDVLAHFFNDFLSAPSFPEALRYNRETGMFEMASRAAAFVSTRIRSALYNRKSQLLTSDPSLLTTMPPIDNHYTVCCLDRQQGMQWIKKERLPFFLQSDCYHEYRLAKLLLQWDPNLCIHRRKSSSVRTTLSAPQLRSLKLNTGFMSTHDLTCLTSLQKEQIIPKSSDSSRCYSSWSKPESLCSFPPLSSSGFSSAHLQSGELKSSQTELGVCSGLSSVSKEKHLKEISSLASHSPEQQSEYLAVQVTEQVLKDTMNVTDSPNQADTCECFSKSGDQANCSSTDRSCKCDLNQHLNRGILEGEKERSQCGKRGCGWDKKDQEEGSRATNQEDIPYICCNDTGFYGSLDKFREFLQGTSGEKLLNLWMDIERLKAKRDKERKHRYLVLMRSCYLLNSSQFSLNMELLSRLGLTTSPCWTEDKLRSVQTCLTEPLLHYWVPRFWTSLCHQEDHNNSSDVELRTEWCYSSSLGSQPSSYSTFLRTDRCSPQSSHTVCTQVMSSRSRLQCSTMMEKMLQALCAESLAGSYFTHFCEQSGNQLWVNALYFWTDLQYYHELFYQDGLDPYRVQREAQFLYSTYLFSSARRSFGVDEKLRREVYDRLMPPFEELFDRVEERALNILVEAWTLMIDRDKESFQQVAVQEEVRSIDSWEYRELRSLYEESQLRLERGEQCSSMLSPSSITPSTHTSDSWSRVSPNYRGYRLGSLLRHRHEIGHFMSFLQNQNASIHLMCWLDLEQYRRTPRHHKAIRQERSACIAARYLNRKYFFGSDSPATTEQQNDILHLAGGLERLKLECLSNPVVMEIQDVVRNHIEKTWLPLFLSTTEFIERQKHRPESQEVAGRLSQHVHRQRRARKEAWKAEGLWMSSTKEILLFRQILLNPVTCQQFQDFVYSKGGFLENDVLFWLEVQRYKDLCHSHSDDATIQQKVYTIISCFINSSMPPALQIDIPPQQAQHILEKRHELGPYIFREAQMSVFDELLKFWPEFQELISSIQEEQLIPLLQEKRVKHRARVRRQRRREEEEEEKNKGRRRAQEDMERQETSVTEEDEDDEDDEEGDDDDDQNEVNEPEERSEKKQSRTRSRVLLTPTQTLSWSYSKYMAGLKREEVLLRRRSQLETTFSTASDSSSNRSIKSASSEQSYRQPSQRSSRTNSKQCNRYNRGVRA